MDVGKGVSEGKARVGVGRGVSLGRGVGDQEATIAVSRAETVRTTEVSIIAISSSAEGPVGWATAGMQAAGRRSMIRLVKRIFIRDMGYSLLQRLSYHKLAHFKNPQIQNSNPGGQTIRSIIRI